MIKNNQRQYKVKMEIINLLIIRAKMIKTNCMWSSRTIKMHKFTIFCPFNFRPWSLRIKVYIFVFVFFAFKSFFSFYFFILDFCFFRFCCDQSTILFFFYLFCSYFLCYFVFNRHDLGSDPRVLSRQGEVCCG
jgi:hypothetical protein